ncbi:MAG: hypothetical protein GXO79_02340 [Chlorobi bacterium]|nr:hypothetical protein [Chlorobiota bacterium]
MKKSVYYWLIAILITLGAAIYQRMTGPTYPKRIAVESFNSIYHFKLPTSHSSSTNCKITLNVNNESIEGEVFYKKYPSNDQWTIVPFVVKNNMLIAELPKQMPAGKLMYHIKLEEAGKIIYDGDNIVVRYKGDVPTYILGPHIFFMFFAMLLSTLAGLLAIGKKSSFRFYSKLTLLCLIIGGMILGPIVQKYAFGELWTGIPFGWDLTDNKTLIGFIGWLVAVIANWKKERPVYSIIAAIILLLIYSIPHSMFGSELDYSSGTIGQG